VPKSQIIKDVVEDSVPLAKSLNRLFVLAKDVKNEELAQWVTKELSGYSSEDILPHYREFTSLQLEYSGINASTQVNNVPLPVDFIDEEIQDQISHLSMRDSISSIQEFLDSGHSPRRDLTYLAKHVYINSGEMVQCISINQLIPRQFLQSIKSEVKSKVILSLLELEKKYGNLDKLGIDIKHSSPIQVQMNNAELNNAVLNIEIPSNPVKEEKWYSKIGWNIIIPIITAVIGAIVATIVISYMGY